MSDLLTVRNLCKHYPSGRRLFGPPRAVRAVDGVDFSVGEGEVLGLVGESGCGKSTVGRTILRLVAATSGEVRFDGVDVLAQPPEVMRRLRRDMQIIFQDPFGSLNPRLTVEGVLAEPLRVHEPSGGAERRERIAETLALVGLRPEHMDRFPHEFSGGQRQRIGIARALILHPKFVVADEAVSALDVSVQAQVLNLLGDLQRRLGISALFISHDLGVIRYVARRVAVMYLGRIVESGPVAEVIREPLHPYTKLLISAVPNLDPRRRRTQPILAGDPPSPLDPPSGCRFHTRCPFRMPRCAEADPPTVEAAPGRTVACHLHSSASAPASAPERTIRPSSADGPVTVPPAGRPPGEVQA